MAAYDYETQSWITDPSEATAELRRQTLDTIALLESPNGRDYASFVGRDYAEMLAEFKAGLAKL